MLIKLYVVVGLVDYFCLEGLFDRCLFFVLERWKVYCLLVVKMFINKGNGFVWIKIAG